ncbi:MAG: leucine--tRNA ligase [Candidatus Aenigmatarchaeota archaeon]
MDFIAKDINLGKIEEKWKKKWIDDKVFQTTPDDRNKYFCNAAFPYVNAPLHLGHGFTYTRIDVMARFKRMRGFNVLYPFGFHATGEPIVGVAARLEKGDEKQKKILLDSGIPEKDINKFKDPRYIVSFWKKRIKEDMDDLGLSIDWSRAFTTIDPEFNKFISWQYRLLRKKGYVVQGTHPVIWCDHCKSPTGDHDRLKGEGEGPIDFTILKFKFEDKYICAATLRPETIFGQTNIWVDPEIEYRVALINDKEKWIVSEECLKKLKDQGKKVKDLGKLKGKDMIGKYCTIPMLERDVIILPSKFCDPNIGTGIVMSVPSHAPYDWQALEDLKKNPKELQKYGLKSSEISKIEPVSIIKVEGFGDHPAKEICEQLGVESQDDIEKLEKATSIIYKKEYHTGVMRDNCGEYSGLRVEVVKDDIKRELIKRGFGEEMWEPSGEVICRCGNRCYVKILENQWFLRFSDERWKQRARECLRMMKIYPEEGRKNFESTIDWLKDKACARRSGLGTKLPWDEEWIIETLSDSVIYMAYYTISNHINENKIKSEQLTDELFDYIFLGKGKVDEIAKSTKLDKKLIEEMKREFEYWYGFDLRGSAKELIPNHLTFCLFHHVAVWDDQEKWPKGMTVNGMLNVEGEKMSKSKGNFIILKDAIKKYGADTVRITLMDCGEGMNDINWTDNDAMAWKNKLSIISNMVEKNYNKGEVRIENSMDLWLISRLNLNIKKVTDELEEAKNRSATTIIHQMISDFNWYLRRVENGKIDTVNYYLECMLKILSIFSPFICEELWSRIGKKTIISKEKWPTYYESKINKEVIQLEEYFMKLVDDVKEVVKLSGKNEKLFIYVVSEKELNHLKNGKKFLKDEFGFKEVEVYMISDSKKYDPEGKSKRAKFGKPGIYVE